MSKRLWPKVYAAVVCYFALSPLYLLPAAALLPGRLWVGAVLPLPALGLAGAAGLLPAKRRTAALILGIVLMTAGCFLLSTVTRPLALLLSLPCAFTMLQFLPAMARPAHQEWTIKHLSAGFVLHLAAQFFKGIDVFQSAAAPLTWMFAVYLFVFLFSYNRSVLDSTGSSTAKALLVQNRRLLAVFCLLGLLLANMQAVISAIRAAILWGIQAGANAIAWFLSLFLSEEAAVAPQQEGFTMMEGMEEASEPSLISQILEILLIAVAALIIAVLLFFLFKHLYKLLRKAFHALLERLKLYRQRITADYEDQSESLLDWGEIRKTAGARLHRVKTRLLPTAWEKLTPNQQVRRVYQLLLRRTDAPDPALTAQEMLQSGALRLPNEAAVPTAALYDRARYSTHPIKTQEADKLRRQAGL